MKPRFVGSQSVRLRKSEMGLVTKLQSKVSHARSATREQGQKLTEAWDLIENMLEIPKGIAAPEGSMNSEGYMNRDSKGPQASQASLDNQRGQDDISDSPIPGVTKYREVGHERRIVDTPWWAYDAISDQTPERIFWITGGLGSGKTTGSAMWFVDRWLLNRNSKFSWGVAPTYTKVEQIIIPAVVQVLFDVYGLQERIHYSLTRTPFWKLQLKGYQHELHFLSGDRPELFVGSNIACWWITEPGLQSREVYEKCQTRLRCPRAIVRQGIGEGTPEGINWYADQADIPGITHDRLDEKRNFRRFIVETTMNKYLTPSPEVYAKTKIRDVYSYDPAKVQSYEKGLFTKFTKGSAYWEFIESRNVTDRYEATPELPIFLSFDFNVSPLAWVAMQEFRYQANAYSQRNHKIVALAESSGESRGLMDAIAEFAAIFSPQIYGQTPIYVFGDASGYARNYHSAGSDYTAVEQYLRGLGFYNVQVRASRANPQIKHRLERVAALMAYEKFTVHVRCKRLIQSFVKTALREGTFEIEKPRNEDWTHYADACTYCLFQLAKEIKLEGLYDYTRPLGANL